MSNSNNEKQVKSSKQPIRLIDIISGLDYPSISLYITSILKSIAVIISITLITGVVNYVVMYVAFYLLNKPMDFSEQKTEITVSSQKVKED